MTTKPTITNTSAAQKSKNESVTSPFAKATVSDSNAAGDGNNKPGTATDTLTITLKGGTGTLSDGTRFTGTKTLTPTGASNTYTLTGTGKAITAELRGLSFTPVPGAANSTTTTTFQLSDTSAVGGSSNIDSTSKVTDTDKAVAPTITNTSAAQNSTDESATNPFTGATVSDSNAAGNGNNTLGTATDTLTITLKGGKGTLSDGTSFTGTKTLTPTGASHTYTLTGTGAAVTAELDALSFTPARGAANSTTTTTFQLSDASSVDPKVAKNSTSKVTNHDPAVAPTITNTSAAQKSKNESVTSPFAKATVSDSNAAGNGNNKPGTATDTLTITLQGGTGTLSDGARFTGTKTLTPTGASNTYTLTGTGKAITAELRGLSFTPVPGAANSTTTPTFQLSDTSAVGGSSNPDSTSKVTDTDKAVAPTITNTSAAQNSTDESATNPFTGATVSDSNAAGNGNNTLGTATDTLTITLKGGKGTLSDGTSFTGTKTLTPTGASHTYTLTGTGAAVTAELDALSFTPAKGAANSTTTTTFKLSDTSSVDPKVAKNSTSKVTNHDMNTTPPSVTFDPSVTFSGPTNATLTGTVSASVGVASVKVCEGAAKLGAATVNSDGTWSFKHKFALGFHTGLTVVATDSSGNSATAPSTVDLTTATSSGVPGQSYTAVQDRYAADGTFLGQTFFEKNGAELYSSDYTTLPNGGPSYNYSGGNFFNHKTYSSFTDIYDANGMLIEDIQNNRDGSHRIETYTVAAGASGQQVHSIGNDLFASDALKTRFVFSKGFGHDTIQDFKVTGPGHDTIALPSFDMSRLAEIIAGAHTVNGDTTIHVDNQDTITLVGVTKAELKSHPGDFKFHA